MVLCQNTLQSTIKKMIKFKVKKIRKITELFVLLKVTLPNFLPTVAVIEMTSYENTSINIFLLFRYSAILL